MDRRQIMREWADDEDEAHPPGGVRPWSRTMGESIFVLENVGVNPT